MTPKQITETAEALGITEMQAAKLEAVAMQAWAKFKDNRERAMAAMVGERVCGRVSSKDFCATIDRLGGWS